MHWIHLTDEQQLIQLITKSQEKPQVIFQHAAPCAISELAKQSMPQIEDMPTADCYFLDVKSYRNICRRMDELFHVDQCPHVLIIRDGRCVYGEVA